MKRHLRIATDIKPVSDFRANAADVMSITGRYVPRITAVAKL